MVCGVKYMHRAHRWSLPYPPSEICHLVTFQRYAACLCIICSQTQTAVSTRKSCLLMEAGCCPSTAGSRERGSQCLLLQRQVHVWLKRPGASWIAASSMKASKVATSMVHNVGRAPEHGAGQGIELKLMARPLAPRDVSPLMVTWMLSQLYCSPGLAHQCVGYSTYWQITSHRSTVKATAPSRVDIYSHRRKVTGRHRNKRCPRVCLNGLRCAHRSVPVFHLGPRCSAMQIACPGKPLLNADQ